MSLIQINFNSESHKAIIMKLCERNNFYKNDVYLEIYKDFPVEFKNKAIEQLGKREYEIHVKKPFIGLESYGYFIMLETKVVGYLIYNIEKSIQKSYLLFILIDKKYQKKGYGSILIEKYLKEIEEKTILYATVKVESEELEKFYKKNGFDNHSDLIENEAGEFTLLHYFPKPSFRVLSMIKKFMLK